MYSSAPSLSKELSAVANEVEFPRGEDMLAVL